MVTADTQLSSLRGLQRVFVSNGNTTTPHMCVDGGCEITDRMNTAFPRAHEFGSLLHKRRQKMGMTPSRPADCDARIKVHVVVVERNQSIRSTPSAHCGSMANIVCRESNNIEVVNIASRR